MVGTVRIPRPLARCHAVAAILLLTGASQLSGQTTGASPPAVENSVVKIFSTARFPDVYRPWTKQAPREGTGTGVIITGHRILTNAHVVVYASQIQVQANQSGDKYTATVEAFSTAMDLAVLKLDDETFFDTRAPLPRAEALPSIKDTVMAYGYPTGGTTLSSPRASSRASSSPPTITRARVCGSRSMRPSTPATAAVPPWSTTA